MNCTTHFHACDCREKTFEELRERLARLEKAAEDAIIAWSRGKDMGGPIHRIEQALGKLVK